MKDREEWFKAANRITEPLLYVMTIVLWITIVCMLIELFRH